MVGPIGTSGTVSQHHNDEEKSEGNIVDDRNQRTTIITVVTTDSQDDTNTITKNKGMKGRHLNQNMGVGLTGTVKEGEGETMDMVLDNDTEAKRCQAIFDLKLFPRPWLQNASLLAKTYSGVGGQDGSNVTAPKKNDRIWTKYRVARQHLEADIREKEEFLSESGSPGSENLQYKRQLQNSLKGLSEDEHSKKVPSSTFQLLLKHTKQRVAGVEFDKTNPNVLKSATVISTIFSPYLLPRAVQFCFRYKHQERGDTAGDTTGADNRKQKQEDYHCMWDMHFISFDDAAAESTNNADKGDWDGEIWKPCLDDLEELCSIRNLNMPTDEIAWRAVKEIDVNNLNPTSVRRIREWLFGTSLSSSILDDFSLLQYIFVSCGVTRDFRIQMGLIGYKWKPTRSVINDMIAYGGISQGEADIHESDDGGVSWLEYQIRFVSGTLRLVDRFYEPYDTKKGKGEWGLEVAEKRYGANGVYEENEKLRRNPWLVWDRSSHGLHGAPTIEHTVLSFIGSL